MDKPKIIIDKSLHDKIMYWVNKCPVECSGFGTAIYDKEQKGYRILSAMMLPNTGSAAETDIKAEDINMALFKLVNEEGVMRWWWHSHVNMGVFWSGTDKTAMETIGQGGYTLATVFNKKGETKSAYYNPNHEFSLFIDDLPYNVDYHPEILAAWEKEYTENFKEKMYVAPTHVPQYYPDYQGGYEPPKLTKKQLKRARKENYAGRILDMGNDYYSLHDDYAISNCGIEKVYPFSERELEQLGEHGAAMFDIDEMLAEGWEREEIMYHYLQGVKLEELI